jgi:hypothetical protein
MLVYGPGGHVNKQAFCSERLWKQMVFVVFIALFCFFLCLSEFELGEFGFRERPAGPEAREKGRIPVEA